MSTLNRRNVSTGLRQLRYEISVGAVANLVDAMNRETFPPPDADFVWAPDDPSWGWAFTTPFSFTDVSTGDPDEWEWDVDNNGVVDYTSQSIAAHTYPAANGQTAVCSVRLVASRMGLSDEETKQDIITIFGPAAPNFDYARTGQQGRRITFTNTSIEPGRQELGGYAYAWDFDDDGTWDSTDENPVRNFRRPGIYPVTFQVTNGAGSRSVVIDLDLRPPGRPPRNPLRD